MTKALTTALIILILVLVGIFYRSAGSNDIAELSSVAQIGDVLSEDTQTQTDFDLVEPVVGFRQNITKKTFGIFITPENSPVENDKFTGYHTGVDSEFTDSQGEIPVRAIADGTLIVSTWTTGYGGVVVIKHVIENVPLFALYGHLDPASFLPSGTAQVKAGDQIGVLGDDHSAETDGVRKHLHFSIQPDNGAEKIDFRGYVSTKEELSGWLNPLYFIK